MGDSETETRACTREDTTGRSCGDELREPGPCAPIGPGCGFLSGERMTTVTTFACGEGVCGSSTGVDTESCTATVSCPDGGVPDAGRDAGFDAGRDAGPDAGPRDAGRDTSVVVDDAGGPCPCSLMACEGRSCPNGGTCGMLHCERGETSCFNGSDDDLDGLMDCADPDCSCTSDAGAGGPEICDNGFDDDGDLAVDCADSACAGQACDGCGFGTCTCIGGVCSGGPLSDGGVMSDLDGGDVMTMRDDGGR
jgi:hypothetical protein